MNKTLKKTLLIAGITVAVCAAVWGGLTLARNAQQGDVNVYRVSDVAMTDYWGDTANTSGTVNTDKLQKIFISETQEVSAIYVKEGQNVKKGDKLLAYDTSLSQAQVEQAEINLDAAQLNAKAARQNLELYRIAEDKEKLQIEYDTQHAKLEALIQAQDKEAGRYEPVKEGLLPVENSDGKTKETPLYYQMLVDSGKKEYYLTDECIRTKILENRASAYVVLVEKAGNVKNGAVTCYGVYLVADDTAAPVKLKMLSDLPPYEDAYSTENTKEIKEAREKLDKIKELLDNSLTKEELKALIASTAKEVYSTQRAVRQAQIGLDKKKKELGEVKIASDVVAAIAALAATEIDGVYSMAGNITNELIGKLGMKNLSKGVKILMEGGIVRVDMMVVVNYGYSIPEVSGQVQERVSQQIENMTGLSVSEVNVRIAGVKLEEN